MTKSKKSGSQVIEGGINIKGNVTIKGSKVAARDNVEKHVTHVTISFAPVYHALKKNATIPQKTKKKLEAEVKKIENEAMKGAAADFSIIQQPLENIQKMAPDIAAEVITTLQDPASGVTGRSRKLLADMQAQQSR